MKQLPNVIFTLRMIVIITFYSNQKLGQSIQHLDLRGLVSPMFAGLYCQTSWMLASIMYSNHSIKAVYTNSICIKILIINVRKCVYQCSYSTYQADLTIHYWLIQLNFMQVELICHICYSTRHRLRWTQVDIGSDAMHTSSNQTYAGGIR